MDVLAHGLWAAAALVVACRRAALKPAIARAAVVASVVPDLLHSIPLVVWSALAGRDGIALLRQYAFSLPGHEPWVPEWVALASHHMHCAAHSAVVAAVLSLVAWLLEPTVMIVLLGWWSHIVIDLFTHSADFYPAPVLYPLSEHTFDGFAWNRPELLIANYLALTIVWWWIARTRIAHAAPSVAGSSGALKRRIKPGGNPHEVHGPRG